MTEGCILIIDDDEVDRKTLCRGLSQIGWQGQILQASDYTQASALASTRELSCIFLDYHIPGTNGLEILSALRETFSPNVPIIMLTGDGNELIAVEAMKRGAIDYLPKALLAPDTISRALTQATEKQKLLNELAKARELLEHQACYDSLTDLGNRSLFRRELDRRIAIANRNKSIFYLLMMDLDRFKKANDTYGHNAGDAILVEVSRRLTRFSRAEDSFYRPGGDEFTAIINIEDKSVVLPILKRIVEAIAVPIAFNNQNISIGISIGVALFPQNGTTSDTLIRAADSAMYIAKQAEQHIAFAN